MADRTDSGWTRPPEPPPSEPPARWRALLDRALLGRTGEHPSVADGHSRDRAPDEPPYGTTYGQSSYASDPYTPDPYGRDPYGRDQPGRDPYGRDQPGRDPLAARAPAAVPHAPGAPHAPPVPQQRAPAAAGMEPPGRSGSPRPIEWRQPARPDDATQQAMAVLRRELSRPRVLAFANPKGGVHKTTATALAAATIGSVRGRGVLAWDDNELRGTLGLRAGSARHARTIRHLVGDLAEVEAYSGLELADRVDDYLRHASDGTYDVLAGEENPKFAQKLDQYTVRRVLELLRRTHDVVCVDTGNNVESANWRTVLQAADQLVITSVPREDAAFTADWMIDLLHEVGLGTLAEDAVTLLSCATPERQPLLDDLHRHFASRTRAVVVVPYDPALESGSAIEPAMLQPATKEAWLHACAVIMEPLTR